MDRRERVVEGMAACLFLVAAVLCAAYLSTGDSASLPLVVGLTVGYAILTRVRFEVGDVFTSAEQLIFVPMLVLLPVGWIPLLVCAASLLSILPDVASHAWHRERWIPTIGECTFTLGPVLVLAALAPGTATLHNADIYALAVAAELVGDVGGAAAREFLRNRMSKPGFISTALGVMKIDVIFSPVAFVIGVAAVTEVWALFAIVPLVWLLQVFSQDRRERYTASLELNRAYRGTVMLLADVVEFEDGYTGSHSRSVVELVHAVIDRMGISQEDRQEMEFAALLHDVGKISIPKTILHKPARLTDEEFELIKTHTIEGQSMLDRVGGLLGRVGEIVRSCHERWDGRGYPDGLAGEAIPLAARIVFACDAYNAMTTNRPYRDAVSKEAAVQELSANSGTQFDPTVVDALIEVVEKGEPEGAATDEMRALLSNVSSRAQVQAVSS
jgi:HD-GYP domain-containing protein (c-di-GMP phosphodiesterase class II)